MDEDVEDFNKDMIEHDKQISTGKQKVKPTCSLALQLSPSRAGLQLGFGIQLFNATVTRFSWIVCGQNILKPSITSRKSYEVSKAESGIFEMARTQ